MKVGFFVPEKGVMVEVEKVDFSRSDAAAAAVQMRQMYLSGKHRMPSPYWCAWHGDTFSFFQLGEGMPSEDVMNAAKAASFWNK